MEWRSSKRFSNPFKPLDLSPQTTSELETLAEVFVSESIRTYEHFLLDENSQVDDNRWKFMYEKDDVRSYAERAEFSSPIPGMESCHRPRSHSASTSELPVVLVTGTIEGDLDDTIYGFTCPTLDMMRIKTSYIQDTMYRACVLATLVEPTAEDPFRSVTVKWVEKGQPLHVRALIKNRDFVYMESTGTRFLRNGERVGYQLVHSVQFPETPARDSAIRGNMSMTAVYRQRDNNMVDVFIKGFLNPAGGLTRSIVTRSAAKALLSVSKNVHCAQMKKLAWSIRQRCPTMERQQRQESAAVCVACLKRPSGTRRLLHRNLCCGVCSSYVCACCRIQKKLHFMMLDRKMLQQEVAFCPRCYREALDAKAVTVASQELLLNDVYGWNERCAYTSGTEISLLDELN
ncbi:hypothetical protein PF005_g13430 [Phytophthora fragariae]|uniref:FYVE-type domain-containing protein n=3 Tax=Phytophthora TaxID=4783 RepID=A0A6A3EPD0_9STRA|nr:hypothetical protein PF003_g12873 [Phytophthora fragariae]KAE8985119.1 hypothetical protein PR001_g22985 [Phytophthora rubi]KAE8935302.1 hypothetical protein PF009_g14739 [Phytophthora fragariae]KAE9105111.1 hypothetical protein PF007_g13815 [Phytophthora fragariae]KAE9142282.1 hypothetical protein PF006_g12589 [Phytophthora fragariae]